MSKSSYFKPETVALHAGYTPEAEYGSRAVPIYQTTSYVFDSVDEASSLFNVEQGGHIYSRISNPTVAVLEQRIAALQGGAGAICTASGMAALYTTMITLCSAGDHIVSASQIYGSTATMLRNTLARFDITTTFVDINDSKALKKAIKKNTKVVFCESIGNPGLEISDLPEIAKVASAAGIPLVVDATFAPPVIHNPIDFGANVVVHSITKWMGGHGAAVGGAIVDAGNFDWEASGRFPQLVEPYEPFHGIRFWDEFGPNALAMKIRSEAMRDLGACLSPNNAFLILQGLETISLRMQQHIANTQALAQWLTEQDGVAWVNHPDLESHVSHNLAKELFPQGAGAVLTFGTVGGRSGGAAFIDALQLVSNLANVGDSRTLVLHPGSTTHSRLSEEAMRDAGISPDMIRVSVGLEHIKDIQADFKLGLRSALKVAKS
ncbi:MAG: O-acetylhomoserine aminocarboxypropyltransferase/cysteine synthase family protein [Pseudomonadota bacterium]